MMSIKIIMFMESIMESIMYKVSFMESIMFRFLNFRLYIIRFQVSTFSRNLFWWFSNCWTPGNYTVLSN